MPDEGDGDGAAVAAARRAPFGDNPTVGERGRATQARLTAAAVTAFTERGYAATRIEHITGHAGCSRPTFYQYFADKEELFGRLAARLGADLGALADDVPAVGPDGDPAALEAWVARLVALHDEHRAVFGAFRAALRGDPRMRAGAEDLTGRYGKAVADAAPAGLGDPLVAALTLTALTGALSLTPALDEAPAGEGRGRVDGLAAVLTRCLSGPPTEVAGPPGPRPPDRPPEPAAGGDVRDDLLAAAATVFPRLGYEATRVDDLVEACGVAHGTFYRYFDGKADLFEEAAARAADATFAVMAALPDAVATDDVAGWTDRWFTTYLSHGAILGVWSENPRAEAGFSLAMTVEAVERLHRAAAVGGDMGVLALLSLLQWAPSMVQLFDGLDRADAQAATALLVARLTNGSGAAP